MEIMRKYLAIVFVISFLAAAGIIVLVIVNKRISSSFIPTTTTKEIRSESFDEPLYLKSKNWGMTDDKLLIVISGSSEELIEPNPIEEYVFEGLSAFFYKVENDSLKVYVERRSIVPENLSTKFTIVQKELSNREMMKLFESYKEKEINKL